MVKRHFHLPTINYHIDLMLAQSVEEINKRTVLTGASLDVKAASQNHEEVILHIALMNFVFCLTFSVI